MQLNDYFASLINYCCKRRFHRSCYLLVPAVFILVADKANINNLHSGTTLLNFVLLHSTLITMADICSICNKSISTKSDLIKCARCSRPYHSACANVTENDLAYLRESGESWSCCTGRRMLRSGSTSSTGSAGKVRTGGEPVTMEQFNKLMQTVQTIADNILTVKTTQEEIRNQLTLVNNTLVDHSRRISENSALAAKCREDIERQSSEISLCRSDLQVQSAVISGCQTSVSNLEGTLLQISDRVNRVQDMVEKHSAPSTSASAVGESSGGATSEEAYAKFMRSHNLIVAGFSESDEEGNRLRDVMDAIVPNSSQSIVSISRLGTLRDGSRSPRLLKVTFNNVITPRAILRNKKTLLATEFGGISVRDDKSLQERRSLEALRRQLKSRLEAGEENLTIKYVKGNPCIVHLSPKN